MSHLEDGTSVPARTVGLDLADRLEGQATRALDTLEAELEDASAVLRSGSPTSTVGG